MSSHSFKSKEGVDIGVSRSTQGIEAKINYVIHNFNEIEFNFLNNKFEFSFHEPIEKFTLTCLYLAKMCLAYNNSDMYVDYVTSFSRGLLESEKNNEYSFIDWNSFITDCVCFYGENSEHINVSLTKNLKELKWEVSIPMEILKFEKNSFDKLCELHLNPNEKRVKIIDQLVSTYIIDISQSNIIKLSMFVIGSRPFIKNDPREVFIERFKKEEDQMTDFLKLIEKSRQRQSTSHKNIKSRF